MKEISSPQTQIAANNRAIYNFLGDFRNFLHLLPDQITNRTSDGDSCSFTIQGLATIGLKFKTKEEFDKIIMIKDGTAPFDFEMMFNIQSINENSSEVVFSLIAGINPMMAMMVSKPLESFVNIIPQKLKEYFEKPNDE